MEPFESPQPHWLLIDVLVDVVFEPSKVSINVWVDNDVVH